MRYNPRTMPPDHTSEEWVAQYASSHQHPVNQACHTLGIPLIVISVVLSVVSISLHGMWVYATVLFAVGWIVQLVGHALARKEPEFFHDWRFLGVGVCWWIAKMRGNA